MKHLYAPWRDEYIKTKSEGCIFCEISQNAHLDDKHHVIFRNKKCFVVMNKYPYTVGHFMVIPHIHIDNIECLDDSIWLQMSKIVKKGVAMLKEGFGAKGVNIGMNLGVAAGAGIAPHIHYHLVPRYIGDTNFITSIADSRVYSTDFQDVYKKLKKLSENYFKEDL